VVRNFQDPSPIKPSQPSANERPLQKETLTDGSRVVP
jgi:hypothetical protein